MRQLDDEHICCSLAYPVALVVENYSASAGHGFDPWVRKIP